MLFDEDKLTILNITVQQKKRIYHTRIENLQNTHILIPNEPKCLFTKGNSQRVTNKHCY
jgi:hypothetical protein